MNKLIVTISTLAAGGMLFLACGADSPTTEVRSLPELRYPARIYAQPDFLYVTHAADEEGRATEVLVYSRKDFKLLLRFGGDGEEPGKFKMSEGHSIWLSFPGDEVAVNGSGKLGFFSKQGEFLRDLPTPAGCAIFHDLADRFVAQRSYYDDQGVHFYTVSLFDSQMNLIKELHKQENSYNPVIKKNRVFTRDLHFVTDRDHVYVKGKPEDFIIHVFNRDGERSRTIEVPYERYPVTESYKQGVFDQYREHPLFGQFFEKIKEEIVFPAFLPAVRKLRVAEDRIYALIYQHDPGQAEFYILDLEGKILDKIIIPFHWSNNVHPGMFDIRDGKLFQMIKNEGTGIWELHITGI